MNTLQIEYTTQYRTRGSNSRFPNEDAATECVVMAVSDELKHAVEGLRHMRAADENGGGGEHGEWQRWLGGGGAA